MAGGCVLLYVYSTDPRRGAIRRSSATQAATSVRHGGPGGVVVVRCPSPSPFPAVGIICRWENDPEVAAKALLPSRWGARRRDRMNPRLPNLHCTCPMWEQHPAWPVRNATPLVTN
uniref:Uncharacterized protein n=1 Tax=Oryza punctata TaxID=4537 RepID=A0A0E0MA83_ORYPU